MNINDNPSKWGAISHFNSFSPDQINSYITRGIFNSIFMDINISKNLKEITVMGLIIEYEALVKTRTRE